MCFPRPAPNSRFYFQPAANPMILSHVLSNNTHLASIVRRGTTDSFLLAWRRSMVVARRQGHAARLPCKQREEAPVSCGVAGGGEAKGWGENGQISLAKHKIPSAMNDSSHAQQQPQLRGQAHARCGK